MPILLSFSLATPRGPVTLTTDLSDMEFYRTTIEIEKFFDAALALNSRVNQLVRETEKIDKKINEEIASYREPVTCDPVMVVS